MGAEIAFLADGIHHLAQNVGIGYLFYRFFRMGNAVFPLECFYFGGKNLLEVIVNLIRVLQGIGINQYSRRVFLGVFWHPFKVGKKIVRAGDNIRHIAIVHLIPGDILVNLLGNGGVIADHNKHGRIIE